MKMVKKVSWVAVKIYMALAVLAWMCIGIGEYWHLTEGKDWRNWNELVEIRHNLAIHAIEGWKLWLKHYKF